MCKSYFWGGFIFLLGIHAIKAVKVFEKIEIFRCVETAEKIKLQSSLACTSRRVLGPYTLFSEDGELFHLPLHLAIAQNHVERKCKSVLFQSQMRRTSGGGFKSQIPAMSVVVHDHICWTMTFKRQMNV